ncbi:MULTISPECIES: bifunctional UDP-sugar hydrolase/5'-nucleotidase [unclassified Undibacterium]|uniref:bifunctional metallophosphatase/5'-nucleotidase n=1 Tax=unclassified Undibacterium TaxID=2630295 RepID=UPI002AC95ABE|nr:MULTISPECIES: bifunctional UDP-sugar hydrolase/5'-nucleotidase [unclassified Undibacterium]MEB0138892.1 bifunctional UDP-sugar hydrolase/5'-nucleotidase [Undibacterium sp. CCC2.1]MEB0171777.1 bifunctional UDP-sugar hydrolase/5'-nucleotidase [Undibacterium sp. CCC1.1]MEB0175523.1 bifunctional UDP-sugar hydrolase/5'-nucleotidase [Undibacterium sp. CCC3.4]MEB0214979.1 bifunctional UDP-sugar hydrolase/5'-nucleotidase [Undibacterium sp. 5I2]WPX44960.1 bifunctional UDP-sugar hydrolase/5'-nucleoti
MFSSRTCLGLAFSLALCASASAQGDLRTVTIFSINDFHGNLQASQPLPYLAKPGDSTAAGTAAAIPAGGYAYLAAKLKQRRAAVDASIVVAAGDLIGAAPMGSALLKDEPTLLAMNRLGLSLSAVGNHEFDAGTAELQRKINGECPAGVCAYRDFHGTEFSYLAANIHAQGSTEPWLAPYQIRQVGDVRIGFIGAVTATVPQLVAGDAVAALRFAPEAASINRYVPELQKQGVDAIVVLLHEGAKYPGPANDPSYLCPGLQGPLLAISKELDPAISLVVSGHTHQAYTCKRDGHLLVQGLSAGAYLTETSLTIDRRQHRVIASSAVNHLIDQTTITPDPQAQALVEQVAAQTATLRLRPVASLSQPILRASRGQNFDSALGNVIADAQLDYAQQHGPTDLAFMNAGGIRADLPAGAPISYADVYATQPFNNQLVRMQLSGAQIKDLLEQQMKLPEQPQKLFSAANLRYRWNPQAEPQQRISAVQIAGVPLDVTRTYSVVANSFLAGGGDGFDVFKQGRERQLIGSDLEALLAYLSKHGAGLAKLELDRVQRVLP